MSPSVIMRVENFDPEPVQTIIIRRCKDMEEMDGITAEDLDQIIKDMEDTPEEEFEYLGDEDMDEEDIDEIDEDEMEEDDI